MERQILEKAIKIRESIENIDNVFEFLKKHDRAYLELTAVFGESALYCGFRKDIQDFVLDSLRDYRSRLEDELDKL